MKFCQVTSQLKRLSTVLRINSKLCSVTRKPRMPSLSSPEVRPSPQSHWPFDSLSLLSSFTPWDFHRCFMLFTCSLLLILQIVS